ncbi:fimbrial protein [Paraburkholderia sediminicola]|uniref:fimbrial protein n=1 Tax=Paraburkholderia sediminicola TaxID=458836 RepID=UPI0038B9F392
MSKSKFATCWGFKVLALAVLALGWTASARAANCTTTGLPKVFTYGTIAVSNSLAVGAVIPGTVQSFTLSGTCPASAANTDVVACPASQSPVSGTTDVYSTGLSGVGMRMRNSSGTPLIGSGNCATTSSLGKTAADGTFNVSGTFELVKTGSISAGTITPTASTATYNAGVLNTGSGLGGALTIASGTEVRPVTCSVTAETANQVIPLDQVKTSALASAGATAGRKPFSIGLSCESGVKVAVTFTSASGSSGIPTVIASNGTATDVGVQLLDVSQTPIILDTALQLTNATTGNASFQFYAQYYRLGAAQVGPGTVNAAAIFTMSYQ